VTADLWQGLTPPYGTIVIDPPWQYNVTKGLPTNGYKPSTAEAHYSTMTMAEVAALPVGDLATTDAHLYMWVTNPRLFGDRNDRGWSPLAIAEAWGFEYKTLLTWAKTGSLGMGWWFRGATEHVLFCARPGAPSIGAALREPNLFTAPRRRHSEKPGVFFDLVERVSPGPRAELFARQPRLGWDSWGHGYEAARLPT
jgi:N6-adenosine-specific RNA methylase IME4